MKYNKVAQFQGELVWVDNLRSGKTKTGRDWSSIDFVLKYTDEQDNERHIMFNVFGNEKVNTIYSAKLGSTIRVAWNPVAREYNGKWFSKNDAYDITVLDTNVEEPKPQTPQNTAPLFQPNHYDGPDIPF